MDWAQFWIATLWVFNIFKSYKKKLDADDFSGLENKPNNSDVTIFQQECRNFFKNFLCSFQLECSKDQLNTHGYILEEPLCNRL